MSWFSRRKPVVEALGPTGLASGVYRSPGMERLAKELDHRHPDSILDLGPSSTENVGFLSRYTPNLSIQDLFHSACDEAGKRSTAFRFGDPDSLELPAAGERFDVVLIWDLIHYFEPAGRQPFVARLAAHCAPNALVFLIASSSAAIPLIPIQFKIASPDSLHYTLPEDERTMPGDFKTRQIEGLMTGFEPLRFFQLRNGLQEFLFRYQVPEEASQATQASQGETADPGPVKVAKK